MESGKCFSSSDIYPSSPLQAILQLFDDYSSIQPYTNLSRAFLKTFTFFIFQPFVCCLYVLLFKILSMSLLHWSNNLLLLLSELFIFLSKRVLQLQLNAQMNENVSGRCWRDRGGLY